MAELSFIHQILKSVQPYAQEMYANRDALIVTTKAHPNDLLTEVDVEIQRRITGLQSHPYIRLRSHHFYARLRSSLRKPRLVLNRVHARQVDYPVTHQSKLPRR